MYNANANYDSSNEGEYYYDFRYGDAAFFVMDTRRHRSDITTEDPATHTMLGDKQLAALHNWLGKVRALSTRLPCLVDFQISLVTCALPFRR